MNVRTVVSSLTVASLAASAFAWNEGETIAYFPFDGDCLSKVNAESNAERVVYCKPDNVEFSSDVKCGHVYERHAGGVPRENKGSIHFTFPGSVAIDMSKFGLGEDLKRLTCDFFFKFKTKSPLSTWTMLARLGVANEITAETGAPSFASPAMFYLQSNGKSPGQLYGAVFAQDGSGKSVSGSRGPTIPDDKWHHAAIVIDGKTADKIRVWFTVDYSTTSYELTAQTDCNWHGQTPTSNQKLYLELGSSSSTKTGELFIDEMRFTAGINASTVLTTATAPYACYWLRQVEDADLWENIADGTALLYCSYDNVFGTSAFDNWPVQSISGSKRYCGPDDVWRGAGAEIWTQDRKTRIRGENLAALTNTSAYIETGLYALKSPNLTSCTIEWFMKCVKDYEDFTKAADVGRYKSLFGFGDGKEPYVLVTQLTSGTTAGDRKYYLRMDCTKLVGTPKAGDKGWESAYYSIPTGTAFWNDDKWHHFAVTVSEPTVSENGGVPHQTIAFYVDYRQVKSYTTQNYLWDGQLINDWLTLWNGSCIDELRISKGVLDVSKFLRPYRTTGLVIDIK